MSSFPQFGELLNQQLAKAERSPAWLARRLGVKASTVGRWLNDGARPGSPELVVRVADVLGAASERERLLIAAGYGYQERDVVESQGGAGHSTAVSPFVPPAPLIATSVPRRTLPKPFTKFVGRHAEIAQITRQIIDPNCRLITLIGPGGIGKTRLAIEVAWQLAALSPSLPPRLFENRPPEDGPFVDGVFYISMAEQDAPEQLSYAMAEALDLQIDQRLDIHQQLLGYLQHKRLLFVLDNLEHRMDAVDRVDQLLQAAPQLHLLVTSRERLHLTGEHLFPVQGLAYAAVDHPVVDNAVVGNAVEAGAPEDEMLTALQLFVQSARQLIPNLALSPVERAHVLRICQAVEGMPLAIELAAAWIELLSPAEIAAEIQRSLDILARVEPANRGGRGEHGSIRAVLHSSWQRLPSSEQEAIARLSAFRAAFTREAAAVVAGASLPVLSALVSKSMLAVQQGEPRRYRLHALLHQFAAEKLQAQAQLAEETFDRLSAHYAGFLKQREERLVGRDPLSAVLEVEAEIENIRLAWQWAIAHCHVEEIDRGVDALGIFYQSKLWLEEALSLFDQAVTAFEMVVPVGEQGILLAKLLAWRGGLYTDISHRGWTEKDYERLAAPLWRSVQIFSQLGAQEEIARPLMHLGGLAFQCGKVEDAYDNLKRALALTTAQKKPRPMSYALAGLAICDAIRGNHARAILHYRQALAWLDEAGDVGQSAAFLLLLADSLRANGDFDEAKEVAEKGLVANLALGNRRDAAKTLQVLSETALNMGNFVEARHYAETELALYREMGFVTSEVIPRVMLGFAAIGMGDLAEARRQFCAVLWPYWQAHSLLDHWWPVDASMGLAQVLAQEGEIEQALELLHHVLNHPAAWQETKTQAVALRDELLAESPTATQAEPRPFQVVVAELLNRQAALEDAPD